MKKILLIFTLFISYFCVQAEVAPLPEIRFNLLYNTAKQAPINPAKSEFIQCKDRLCLSASALGVYGSQHFSCTATQCQAVSYEFEPFAQLTLTFADGTVQQSNVFPVPNQLLNAFDVYIGPRTVTVNRAANPPQEALWKRPEAYQALGLILVLELLCATAFILYTKKRFTILYGVAIANIVTAAFVWCVLVHYIAQSAVWWLACVVLETLLIGIINRKDLSFKEAGLLSIMTNVTSYTLGMIFSFMWAQI